MANHTVSDFTINSCFVLQTNHKTSSETLADMKKHVQYLERQMSTNVDYLKRIYEFTFKFSLEEGQRTLRMFTAFLLFFLMRY